MTGQTGKTDLTFKLNFPGKLCEAALAILAMFVFHISLAGSYANLLCLGVFLIFELFDP